MLVSIFTAHKRSLRRLCFYMCLSVHWRGGGGGIPACLAGGIPACLAGGIPACLAGLQWGCIPACLAGFQAHTQGEVEESGLVGVFRPTPRGSPGPHLGVSIPTPRGVSRPTAGGSPGPPLKGGVSQHTLRQTPAPQLTAIAASGTHPTSMHSCCLHLYIFLMVLWKHQRLGNLCEQFTVSSSQSGKIGTKFAYQRIGLS